MTDKHIAVLGTNYQSVAFDDPDEGLMPSIIVYVSNEDMKPFEETTFYLEQIETEDVPPGMARLICSTDEEIEDLVFFVVPLAMVGLLTVFGDSKRSMLMFLYGEEYMYTMETGETLEHEECLGFIKAPPVGTESFQEICEAVSEEVSMARTLPMISTLRDDLSPTAKKARELAFLVTAGIALGEEHSMRQLNTVYELLVNMEQRKSGSLDSLPKESMLAKTIEEHDEVLMFFTSFMHQAYEKSEQFIHDMSIKSEQGTQEYSDEDLEFVNILSEDGILDKLNNISFNFMKERVEEEGRTPELNIRAPLWPEWPGIMSGIEETFAMQSYPTTLLSFLDGKEKSLQEFNDSLTTLAYALTLSGRARRFVDQLELHDHKSSTTGMLVLWFNDEEEKHTWEITALKHSLQHYDMSLSRDLLSYSLSNDEDPETAFWLHAVTAGFLIVMIEQRINPDQLLLIVKESEIQPKDMKIFTRIVGQFILTFYKEILEQAGESSQISVDKKDLLEFSADYFTDFLADNEDVSLQDIAENFSILFPILSDKNAEDFSLGSEEWTEARENFLHEMLETCSWERAFT